MPFFSGWPESDIRCWVWGIFYSVPQDSRLYFFRKRCDRLFISAKAFSTVAVPSGLTRQQVAGESRDLERSQSLSIPLSSRVCLSAVTRAELRYGLKRLPPEHGLHMAVHHFFKIVRVLPWDAEAADWYADIRYQLVATGQPIGELDMMIAAHALSSGAVLVTNNERHFQRIKAPLFLENWA